MGPAGLEPLRGMGSSETADTNRCTNKLLRPDKLATVETDKGSIETKPPRNSFL